MSELEMFYMIVGIAVGVISIIAGFAGAIRWLVKHYLQELKPNGGSSLKDQINRLEARIENSETWGKETYRRTEKLEEQIDDLYAKLIRHLDK
jgi:hypothetical protein